MTLTWMKTLGLGVAMHRELLFSSRDDALLMNNKGYIFIVRRLGKQSKLILSRSDCISNLELNLKIHGPCGPNAHAEADLQAFLIFCFKPILLSAQFMAITHALLVLAMIIPKSLRRSIFPLMPIKTHCNHHGRRNISATDSS